MSRILISILLCTALIIAQDSVAVDTSTIDMQQIEKTHSDTTDFDSLAVTPISLDSTITSEAEMVMDSLVVTADVSSDTTRMDLLLSKSKGLIAAGKEFVIEHKKLAVGISTGIITIVYFIVKTSGGAEPPSGIGQPPGWPE